MKRIFLSCALSAAIAGLALAAEPVGTKRVINDFPTGSISNQDGLKVWQKFYEIASHPRCSNCHVGKDRIPMWSGPSYGKTRPHGMYISGGATGIGAGGLVCGTCHGKSNSKAPHGPPGVDMPWRLAPVEAEWFGKSSHYICNQLKDRKRNGNMSIREIAAHLDHDLILHWAWAPGGKRQPAPYSLQQAMDFLMMWSAAGTPCPKK